jgi:non-ribosomal peptide synthase protein (TIGR01720 family)
MSLPPKTTSFKSWAERLREHAQSDAFKEEMPYWLSLFSEQIRALPMDTVEGENLVASARTVSASLSGEETRALLQDLPATFRTQINEVLLTALARVFSNWTDSSTVLLEMEGHGREEILEGVDLSRTVGWFTSIFPVVLRIEPSCTPSESLRVVKEQFRAIPNRGIGYGLLRYLSGNTALVDQQENFPQAQVRFNYLGQLDRALNEASLFIPANRPSGPTQSAKGSRAYLLNIIGAVSNGELRFEWTYSANIHRPETIERLARKYIQELQKLIVHSQSSGEASYLPSDFPKAKLSKEDLNKVLGKLRG